MSGLLALKMACAVGRHISYKLLKLTTLYNKRTGITFQKRNFVFECNVEQLQNRGLLRVSGNEVSAFIQGLITNDIRHLDEGARSLFTMILNTKGRVLYDAILYKMSSNCLFVECDILGLQGLDKHFKMFRVRRKVDIQIEDEFKVWTLFNPNLTSNLICSNDSNQKDIFQERIVPCISPKNNEGEDLMLGNKIVCFKDPRLPALGMRVLAPSGLDVMGAVDRCGIKVVSSSLYRMFRYQLGVGEGIEELPTGKCFPLEANCDYLHGVSFHKGCYIGQEVTARTHHTGVVRKRLMPLILDSEETDDIEIDSLIEDWKGNKKTPVGKLRGIERSAGIGLMRIAESLELEKLKIGNITGKTVKPFWWPQESPKDRVDAKKE